MRVAVGVRVSVGVGRLNGVRVGVGVGELSGGGVRVGTAEPARAGREGVGETNTAVQVEDELDEGSADPLASVEVSGRLPGSGEGEN